MVARRRRSGPSRSTISRTPTSRSRSRKGIYVFSIVIFYPFTTFENSLPCRFLTVKVFFKFPYIYFLPGQEAKVKVLSVSVGLGNIENIYP